MAAPMAPIGETVEQRPPGGTRSTLGPQVIKASAPSYGFGSGTREVAAKVFVSQEHSALTGNPCSPGPATFSQPASIGPQVNGVKQSAPRFGFGTSTREHQSKVYISAEHEKVSGGQFAPGPHYDFETGIGKQVDSKKTSLPLFGFGTSTREHQSKVYISAEHEKVTGSGEGPGKNYLLRPTLGNEAWIEPTSPGLSAAPVLLTSRGSHVIFIVWQASRCSATVRVAFSGTLGMGHSLRGWWGKPSALRPTNLARYV
tara:strand:- start:249 stop:1019 length:771 start_codon:yes stop_codon:yes gene_type:complete